MQERFEQYLNKYFKKYKKTNELVELKEEILNNLLEKSKKLEENSIAEEVYYKCIKDLGDINLLLKEYKKDYNKLSKKIELPKYKLSEELINAISHGLGALFSIAGLILGIIKSTSGIALFSILVYMISSFILYLTSCLYHSLKRNNGKRVFRILDHSVIYLLIAGTYTPIVLMKLPGYLGWLIFGIVWTLAVVGIILNSIDIKKFKIISMILYLGMGWCILFSFKPLWLNMNHIGIYLIFLGGIIYTLGAIIYGIGKKVKYMHSIFHIFCLLASFCFYISIYLYVL